jgi:uncharacterized membrane protein YeaQ/YmgE (transglycosylase-associated protein family)
MLWHMSQYEWISSFGFVCCICYIVGWLSDGILKSVGFGHIGNWLILLIGSYAAMYSFNLYGYHLDWYPLFTLTVISSITCGFFLSMCLAKHVFE